MFKVKTFTSPLKIFEAKNELLALDQTVNAFLEKTGVKRVISVNDACTTDDSGATIGLVRVVAYEI
jgi:hypothetical protein